MSPNAPRISRNALALALLALVLSACAPMGTTPDKPNPAAPQITEQMLRDRAKEQLASGLRQYGAGEFENALKAFTSSLDHGLLSRQDQSLVRKHLAFIHCVGNRETACRDEFRKAFEINPEFALTAAEDGHPIWGPVYRNVRTQLIVEREAVAARGKSFLPLAKAEQFLADARVKYDAGDYAEALKLYEGATKEGLKGKDDRLLALKYTAFCQCLLNRYPQCRTTFTSLYEIDPDFDLTPAEAGHPSWARTFASAKAGAKKAIADKAAKDRAAAPAKKN